MYITKDPVLKYKYAFVFAYDNNVLTFCRSLKTRYGNGQFGYADQAWRFNDLNFISIIQQRYPATAVMANMQADMELFELQQQEKKVRIQRAQELKLATVSDLQIAGLKRELYPYQKIGVEFFSNNRGRAILADQMGAGKSYQAIAYVVHEKLKKTLVVCPASVKYSWFNEIKKTTHLQPYVINSSTDFSVDVYQDYDVIIINYDILKKFFKQLTSYKWDCAIYDEFHYIKNINAQRTKLAKIIASKINSVLLLSGTPLLNRPVELFNGLQIIDPVAWDNYYAYTIRYCEGKQGYFGWEASGASNIDELKKRIEPYFLRRTKDQVLKDLPPKRYIDIPIKLDDETDRKYRFAERSFIEYLRDVKKKNRQELQRSLQAEHLTKLSELRQLTTSGKIEAAIETIENIIDGGEKVVVFSVYNEPLKKLKEKFGDQAVILMGDTDIKDRTKMIEDFQNKDKIKVFLGGIKSAGVGITLTAASNVLFIDYSWVPADHAQAADRIHRIGQTAESVSIYQLYAIDTIDQYMKDILADKQQIFDQLMGGDQITTGQVSIMDDLIKLFGTQIT